MGEQEEILLVGDNKKDLGVLEALLKKLNYSCVWKTTTCKEALELSRQRNFFVTIVDLMFLVKNSDLIKRLKQANLYTSLIVAAPYNLISKAISCMEEGAFGYITKPFNHSEVRIVIEHAIEHFFLKGADKEKNYYFKLSIVDGLTGLYNVRYLWEVLSEEVRKAREYPARFSLLMLDIDDFKKYNDKHGHQAGDKLLKDFSNLIDYAIRRGDSGFRYGGEEFVVFLPNTGKEEAHLIGERILGFVRLHLPVTVSIGLASFPEDGMEVKVLIKRADDFLYKAKASGKDCVCFS